VVDVGDRLADAGDGGCGSGPGIAGDQRGEAAQRVAQRPEAVQVAGAGLWLVKAGIGRGQPGAQVTGGGQRVVHTGPVRPDGVHQADRHRLTGQHERP
jgi:hypothetical protein